MSVLDGVMQNLAQRRLNIKRAEEINVLLMQAVESDLNWHLEQERILELLRKLSEEDRVVGWKVIEYAERVVESLKQLLPTEVKPEVEKVPRPRKARKPRPEKPDEPPTAERPKRLVRPRRPQAPVEPVAEPITAEVQPPVETTLPGEPTSPEQPAEQPEVKVKVAKLLGISPFVYKVLVDVFSPGANPPDSLALALEKTYGEDWGARTIPIPRGPGIIEMRPFSVDYASGVHGQLWVLIDKARRLLNQLAEKTLQEADVNQAVWNLYQKLRLDEPNNLPRFNLAIALWEENMPK